MNTTSTKLNLTLKFKDLEESIKLLNQVERYIVQLYVSPDKNDLLGKLFEKSLKENVQRLYQAFIGKELCLLPKDSIMLEYNDGSKELYMLKPDGLYKMDLDKVREKLYEMFSKSSFTIDS